MALILERGGGGGTRCLREARDLLRLLNTLLPFASSDWMGASGAPPKRILRKQTNPHVLKFREK